MYGVSGSSGAYRGIRGKKGERNRLALALFLGLDVSYLHVVGDSWLFCEAEDGDGVQGEVAGSRGYAGVAEEEEALATERYEVDGCVRWQEEAWRRAGEDYCARICEESGLAGRQVSASRGHMPAVDVLVDVEWAEGGYSEGSVEIVVVDLTVSACTGLSVSAASSEVAPAPETETGARGGATCEGEGYLPLCCAVGVGGGCGECCERKKDQRDTSCELDC